MPISGTHSIVGAVLGFSLVCRGFEGINWIKIAQIVGSWFVSPVLSGIVSGCIFMLIRRFILNKEDPITPGLASLPIFYGLTIFINIISILLDGPDMLKIDVGNLPAWTSSLFGLAIGLAVALCVALGVYLIMVPRLRKSIAHDVKAAKDPVVFVIGNGVPEPMKEKEYYKDKLEVIPMDGLSPNSSAVPLIKDPDVEGQVQIIQQATPEKGDKAGVGKLFSFLQILTAAFGSFAHGGNDVSNAIGPLIALWLVYQEGSVQQKAATPIYLLIYGGVGISLGLWIWGRRVIKTMGEDLTQITPSSGFTIEIGAAMTVLVASKIGLPISTTHCKVGSVVFVGWLRTKDGVDWKLFRNIIFAWLVTVPVSGSLSAFLMFILKQTAM
jgi:sodium-dependent phosphate transporter